MEKKEGVFLFDDHHAPIAREKSRFEDRVCDPGDILLCLTLHREKMLGLRFRATYEIIGLITSRL